MLTYTADWWQIELPEGWLSECDDACHSFYYPGGAGALQINAYRKDTPISDFDLFDLIDLEEEAREHLAPAMLGGFSGHQLLYSEDGIFWHKWWVYHENLLLHVTYTCPEDEKHVESLTVRDLLDTLKPASAG